MPGSLSTISAGARLDHIKGLHMRMTSLDKEYAGSIYECLDRIIADNLRTVWAKWITERITGDWTDLLYSEYMKSYCYIWNGSRRGSYGLIVLPKWELSHMEECPKKILAHRASYLACKGYIIAGKVVRHLCCNKLCINPAHLELGTQAENMEDDRKFYNWRMFGTRDEGEELTEAQITELCNDLR